MSAVTITAGVRDEASPVLAKITANAQASARQIDRAAGAAAPGAQRSLFAMDGLSKQLQRLAMSSSLVNGILGTEIPDAILTIAVKMPMLLAPFAAMYGAIYSAKQAMDSFDDSVQKSIDSLRAWIKEGSAKQVSRRLYEAQKLGTSKDEVSIMEERLKMLKRTMKHYAWGNESGNAFDRALAGGLKFVNRLLGDAETISPNEARAIYKDAADEAAKIEEDLFRRKTDIRADEKQAVDDARDDLLKDAKDALDAEYEYEQEQTQNFLRSEKEKADALKATADLREELLRDNSEALDAEYAHEKMRTDDYLRGLKEREEAERDAAQKKAESIKAGAKDKEAELNRRLEDVRRRERVRNAMLDAADPADVRQAESHQKRAYEKDERERQHRVDRAMKAMRKGQRLKPWQREIIEAGKQAQAPQKTAEEKLLEDIKNLQKETKDLIDKALKLQ